MATGNIFLGQARRSVGDVTFYRTRGEQRSRVRVRKIANPRTLSQLKQRAIVANIARLYSAGRSIFDHSFQGYKQGQDNQLRFNKVNIARLRALVESDIAGDLDRDLCAARFGARGVSVPVPFVGLQVSEGSLPQAFFSYNASTGAFSMPAALESDSIASYASRTGLVPDDIYTFVVFAIDNSNSPVGSYSSDSEFKLANIYPCSFAYLQFKVLPSVASSTEAIYSGGSFAKISKLFEVSSQSGFNAENFIVGDQIVASDAIGGNITVGPFAVIRSHYGEDVRSTAFLVPSVPSASELGAMPFGITYNELAAAWGDTSGSTVNVEEILDGSDFQQ